MTTWYQAEKTCVNAGGHIYSMTDIRKDQEVVNQFYRRNINSRHTKSFGNIVFLGLSKRVFFLLF